MSNPALNILIVDDDLVDRTHIHRTLSRSGFKYHIVECEDVNSALLELSKQPVDAILLDYNMPQRNGLELIHALKTENTLHGSAIIMMSTSEEEEIAMQCLQEGAQDFIAKSDITGYRLRRAILGANARFEMEQKLKESYRKVKQMAEQDDLTKLGNRYLFDESLKQIIDYNVRGNFHVALVLFDLDHFKYVNDTYGHDVGDKLLQKVVHRIQTCLRGQELFCRLGGDEFALVLNQLKSNEEAEKVAVRILRVLEKNFLIGNADIDMGASIGVAFYPDNANGATELFKCADMAMYRAKHLGRNQIAFFEKELQDKFLKRYQIETELKSAEALGQMYLNFQPIFDGESMDILGFETLLRWNRPGSPIYPDEFIPIAEECKVINTLGKWVAERSIAKLVKWQKIVGKELNISINLSPVQLSDSTLLEHIKACLKIHNIRPRQVEFEITETALLDDSAATKNKIIALSKLGCRIALDDFGTGFSSISHLQDFPIDTVKIDKSLMPHGHNDDNSKLIRALTAMLQYLELEVVAEGIENEFHLTLCRQLKINRFQGFHLSKPLDNDQVVQLLNTNSDCCAPNATDERKQRDVKVAKRG